ncbi:MAG TPA: ribonuclease J [Candidatus Olsenella excrementigallinarum]|uniref:ribonuclease J n=1 Tax=Olsenella timonensis TaxID=1805478 RepID=UPI00094F145E|nr:ribonuclease J [Olsenella timonensis]HJB49071.1 ribonuclease J [Candidatus Olsenella excrementigallinarum]
MPKKDIALRIIPLGGLDGIGKNMTAFEYGNDMILVDAGLMFPDEGQPGIDLILPDYTYVLENEDKLRGIIITHGHEDHTGALPYLLQDLTRKVPIYSSKLTLGIIQGKFEEHNIKNPKTREVNDGTTITLGAFTVTFFSMTHSIPAAFGVFVSTPAGTVMHTGDFKFDQTPIDGRRPNFHAINKFGAQGVDLLLSDSTNATRPGFTPSEAAVGRDLRHVIKNARGRVFVAAFSSHIHRLQQICDASVAVGRKVVVTGRSMLTNTKVARELGYLRIDEENIIDAYDVDRIPDEKVVVLCTGSQGEPLSALARMATGEHKSLSIHESDTVVISATPIPGNEKSVQSIINALSKIGCEIYDKSKGTVHVSGHASAEELKLMLAMARPRFFMPVHGEAQHLRAHAELGVQMGVPRSNVFVLDNGDSLEMVRHKVRRGRGVESGVVYVDGGTVTEADPVVLRDRQKLGADGVITATVVVAKRGRSVSAVEVLGRGLSSSAERLLQDEARDVVVSQMGKLLGSGDGASVDALRRGVRNALSNLLWNRTRTRPMIIPVVMEV